MTLGVLCRADIRRQHADRAGVVSHLCSHCDAHGMKVLCVLRRLPSQFCRLRGGPRIRIIQRRWCCIPAHRESRQCLRCCRGPRSCTQTPSLHWYFRRRPDGTSRAPCGGCGWRSPQQVRAQAPAKCMDAHVGEGTACAGWQVQPSGFVLCSHGLDTVRKQNVYNDNVPFQMHADAVSSVAG